MKFGKQLLEEVTPEWQAQFIDYRQLKKSLKPIKQKHELVLVSQAKIEDETLLNYVESDIVEFKGHLLTGLSDTIQSSIHYRRETQHFFDLLEKELKKVNRFYAQIERDCCMKHAQLLQQAQICHKKSKNQTGSSSSSRSELLKKDSKQQVLVAYQEHYRSLVLLQNYRVLNYTGFTKILKKYIKVSKNNKQVMNNVLDMILDEPFYSSPMLRTLIGHAEENVTKYLCSGNHKSAMKSLRLPNESFDSKQSETVLFRSGIWFGCSIVLTLVALYFYLREYTPATEPVYSEVSFFMFRVLLFPILLAIFIAINLRVWTHSHINYVFIFELDPRKHISKHVFLEIALISYVIWITGVVLYMYNVVAQSNGTWFLNPYPWIYPIVIASGFLMFLLFPHPRWFLGSARLWFLRTLFNIVVSPFSQVRFKDFWLADQLTSMSEFLFEVQFVFCIYPANFVSPVKAFCDKAQVIGVPVFNAWPFYARMMQCFRRYYDDRQKSHLVNAGKYGMSLFVILFAFVHKAFIKTKAPEYDKAALIVYFTLNIMSTLYKFSWDILRDWGLFHFKDVKYMGLRKELRFYAIWYYLAVIVNFGLRFMWIVVFVVRMRTSMKLDIEWFLFLTAFAEIARRGIWNIFRLENEHLNNCGKFRAVLEVPLPFHPTDMQEEQEEEDNKRKRKKTNKNYYFSRIIQWFKKQPQKLDDEEKRQCRVIIIEPESLQDNDQDIHHVDLDSLTLTHELSPRMLNSTNSPSSPTMRKSVSMPAFQQQQQQPDFHLK
jgi:hypothetical protein